MASEQQPIPGGWSKLEPATPEVQGYIDQVKPDVEKALERTLQTYVAKSYTSQVVAGTNYLVKVNVGDGYIHVRLFVSLEQKVKFEGVSDGKKEDDPLDPK